MKQETEVNYSFFSFPFFTLSLLSKINCVLSVDSLYSDAEKQDLT